ncbi:TraK [Legionella geestiana]|uniref:TraK n=1 Tax=Legionella geestiana TaxID=45065 RepID=A0A0W0U7I7_9GAMM|nr:TraK family protein [Legionella geestiana]KTD03713.1 TraK [Legionella geestiana]QBS11520.1 conjugal transfer protein TraK [Legionella geestiana]STX53815.1 protein TraK [Legionella geestiana]
MSKTLSERLALCASQKSGFSASRHRVDFLLYLEEIESALQKGWSSRAIWQMLTNEGRITFSYKTFCAYVRQSFSTQQPESKDKTVITPVKTSAQSSAIPGFTFNAVPNLKELI